jgi:hypothetical protein
MMAVPAIFIKSVRRRSVMDRLCLRHIFTKSIRQLVPVRLEKAVPATLAYLDTTYLMLVFPVFCYLGSCETGANQGKYRNMCANKGFY